MILAGDIGGTKTHLALFDVANRHKIIKEKKYPSKSYPTLLQIIKEFLLENPAPIKKICLGVAGPVEDGVCKTTNLPWVVEAKVLSKKLDVAEIVLLNDLEAMAYGVLCLPPEDFCVLHAGNPRGKGNAALIAAGTGLGQAGLYWDGGKHHPFTSEGGHSDFAPQAEEELALWHYLQAIHGHVSYERVLSGPGLYTLYRFLIETGREEEPEWMQKEFIDKDPPRVVVEHALKKKCRACQHALELFVSLYGSQAGNVALQFLSLGGLYIGGGIAPHIVDVMQSGIFTKSFLAKGRLSPLLHSVPVKIILNEKTALFGAASR